MRGFAAASSPAQFHADFQKEEGKYKISPAAGWWMRAYGVLPSEVTATGPKGFILKGDVLKIVRGNKLQLLGPETEASQPAASAQSKAKAPASKPAKKVAPKSKE